MLQAAARTAFAAIRAMMPHAVVAVTFNGRTAQGIKDNLSASNNLTNEGQAGLQMGIVRVAMDELDTPTAADHPIIGGVPCSVGPIIPDDCGAIMEIYYQQDRPVTASGEAG